MNDRQKYLFTDLPRGEQLAALRKLELPAYVHKSGKVSGAIQKAVLRCIDDHEGRNACWASQATIAAEIGRGVRTVARAIAGLIELDLITCERPNRMAPNHHRIAWNSVKQLVAQRGVSVAQRTVTVTQAECQHDGASTVTVTPSNRQHDGQTVQLNSQINDHTTDADAWAVMMRDLYRWGLKSAADAVGAARDRGWSIEYVRELFIESGGEDTKPEPWQPGQLANWLTGRKPAPFDEAEAEQRRTQRDAAGQAKANEIRESVTAQAEREERPVWVAAGIAFRKLSAAGLERFASDAEREAVAKLDAADRRKKRGGVNRLGALV